MTYSTITFQELQTGVGLLTLNRPERLNALNMAMLDDLQALFQMLASREDIRVLILTGAGRGFCSGADLKDTRRLNDPAFPGYTSPGGHLVHIQKNMPIAF